MDDEEVPRVVDLMIALEKALAEAKHSGGIRRDLRVGKHLCAYRKTPHQVQGGCGCLCDLCELQEADNLSPEGDTPLPISKE